MPDIQTKLAARLKSDDALERCGFVTKRGRIIELKNVADKPEDQFRIAPADTLKYLQRGDVVATWHTHPRSSPNLSGEDYECFLRWDDLDHYVVGRREGEIKVVRYFVEDGLVVQE